MGHYDGLLNSVIAHIRQAHSDTQNRNLRPGGSRDFRFTPASQTPRSAADFELVTWLVVMDDQLAVSRTVDGSAAASQE